MKHPHLYQTDVTCVEKDAKIERAAQLMRDHHVGDVVVVETRPDGKRVPIGMLTDRDIVIEIVAKAIPLDKLTVGDVMAREVVVVPAASSLFEIAWLMRLNAVHRLPVVDQSGALCGIISADDVLEIIGMETSALAKISRYQRRVEKDTVAANR